MTILGLPVHFYGLMYALAFALAALFLPWAGRLKKINRSWQSWLELTAWAAVGVIVGGRLGYVIFYEPVFYWHNPVEMLWLVHGGMSAHGGFIGVGVAIWLWSRVEKICIWRVLDLATIPAGIGLALGRTGNFINGELYGTPAAMPWGVNFAGVAGARYPVQIYEALGDIIVAMACLYLLRRVKTPGKILAVFLIAYSILRFIVEFVREPEWAGFLLTRGQWLTLPLLVCGLWVWWRVSYRDSVKGAHIL